MTYAKGDYQTYRAVTKIHLGAISDNLFEGEEVLYDGHTLKRGGGEHPMHTLRSAIKVGWLVPVEDQTSVYIPQPAGVTVHRADGVSDEEINLATVYETDVNVGTLDEVRPDNAPKTHVAVRAGEQRSADDGVVVATFKTSAKQASVEIGKDDRKVVSSLDNKTTVEVEKVVRRVATGDVEEARTGEHLADLLPDAASAGTPISGESGEGTGDQSETRARAYTAKGSTTIGGAEEGTIVATLATGTDADNSLSLIHQFIPGFAWDMDVQWAKRVKMACEKYGDIPLVLKHILSVETPTVKKHINKRLSDSER